MLVRVPDKLYHQMAQMLDIGAEGLILPQVKTQEEAKHIIQSTKYSPLGRRGVSISETVTLFRDFSQAEYTRLANEETLIVVQIESREGLDNMDRILSVKGVDAVMVGPADLSQDMGIPGDIRHPEMEKAFRDVIAACNRHGVAPGIHFSSMEDAIKWANEGMRFITYSYDIRFFKEASREALWKLKSGILK